MRRLECHSRSTHCAARLTRRAVLLCALPVASALPFTIASAQTALQPASMKKIADVDPRYVSYNIETVEVTGGRFWKPYKSKATTPAEQPTTAPANANQPAGMDASLYQYRSPIDLGNPRLRKLATALSPAYVRVSGTWRNTTYFQNDNAPLLTTPPKGFKGVMSRKQWKGVVDFAHATGSEIVASVAVSDGTRDADGAWTPVEAKPFFEYTRSIGGRIAATEFMNEPTFAAIGGAPASYDGPAFARDAKLFKTFLKAASPGTIYLGPGSIGEGIELLHGAPANMTPKVVPTEGMLKASGPIFDAFSYHFYMSVSKRCTGAMGAKFGMKAEDELKPEWLERNLAVEKFYSGLRDTYASGAPMWLTETGEAACGGDPFAAQFVDSFRYVDQLGSLAQRGVKTVMQNTLASSDYGMLDEDTLDPRPNFWAAVLWKKTMGTRVLDPGFVPAATMRVYAQCLRNSPGGVAIAALNLSDKDEQSLNLPIAGERFTLSSPDIASESVRLNGLPLTAAPDGSLPAIKGQPTRPGPLALAPLTITFVSLPSARNPACMR